MTPARQAVAPDGLTAVMFAARAGNAGPFFFCLALNS